jgi:hypothetical protein
LAAPLTGSLLSVHPFPQSGYVLSLRPKPWKLNYEPVGDTMRLVSENSPEQLARNRGAEQLRDSLIELAANIIRVVRGAGKPVELMRQADEFLNAVVAYREAVGYYPDPTLFANALLYDHRLRSPR